MSGSTLVRDFQNALDCCGTCAGGVLARVIEFRAAEVLRAAADAAVSDSDDRIPWDHDHDRATVAVWLRDRADLIDPVTRDLPETSED